LAVLSLKKIYERQIAGVVYAVFDRKEFARMKKIIFDELAAK